MDRLEIEAHRITQTVQHRGYVIDAWARRDSFNTWVAQIDVTLRGRPITLETDAPTHFCATEAEAICTALERAQQLIDCREGSAIDSVPGG
jgi:hypothetical protein